MGNSLVLLPAVHTGSTKPTRLYVVSGRGDIESHHYTYTFRPFFERHRELLSERFPGGFELVAYEEGAGDVREEDFLVWWQPRVPQRALIDRALPFFSRQRRIMFHYENPVGYHFRRWTIRDGYHDEFGQVFSSAAMLVDGAKTFWSPNWNYYLDFISQQPARPFICDVPADRKLLAINPIRTGLDISRKRLQIIDQFLTLLDECELFGSAETLKHPWVQKWQHRYAGEIPFVPGNHCYAEKISIFNRYRFVLVVENTFCDWYISEKLAEPLAALTVPVYFGNPKVSEYLPNLFGRGVVNGHAFKDLETLIAFVRDMSDLEYRQRVECIRTYRDEYLSLTSFRNICDYVLAKALDVPEIFEAAPYHAWSNRFEQYNTTLRAQEEREKLLQLINLADDAQFADEIESLLLGQVGQ